MLFGCRKCGTLLLNLGRYQEKSPNMPHYADVTEHWQEISEWYASRLAEIRNEACQRELALQEEVPEMLTRMLGRNMSRISASSLKLMKR